MGGFGPLDESSNLSRATMTLSQDNVKILGAVMMEN